MGDLLWVCNPVHDEFSRVVFENEYLGVPFEPLSAELYELAEQYYVRTELYDRAVCSCRMPDGTAVPENGWERAYSTRHALDLRRRLNQEAEVLGYSPKELREAMYKVSLDGRWKRDLPPDIRAANGRGAAPMTTDARIAKAFAEIGAPACMLGVSATTEVIHERGCPAGDSGDCCCIPVIRLKLPIGTLRGAANGEAKMEA